MSGAGSDPVVDERRARITETDLEIVDAVNRRLRLVADLHAHKRAHGHPLRDHDRERRLMERLDEANGGPISRDGLHRLYAVLIEICTAEAARLAEQPSSP
ncbi:MAG TPA: chorismate mutase [Gaiellales bacterium]|nr:chorismate mutase [Gaiellales bacterium]